MSHANGLVKFPDGEVMHFEYNGTCDIVCAALKRTYAELRRDWRSPANEAKCICEKEEPVEMMTDYGAGYSWNGKACRHCMAITEGLMPHDTDGIEVTRGIPEWSRGGFYLDNTAICHGRAQP